MNAPGNAIVELRQYTLHPGARDTLITLFEREFVESQEACGMTLIGTFRDADDPDRFVWLRGFPDMASRARSLAAFYGGGVWAQHRNAANATMIDSDDVLLLRPAWPGSDVPQRRVTVSEPARGVVVVQIHHLEEKVTAAFIAGYRATMGAAWPSAGAESLAVFASEHAANTYKALPVRENVNVVVSCALLEAVPAMLPDLPADLADRLARPVETLRLHPTSRSRWHL